MADNRPKAVHGVPARVDLRRLILWMSLFFVVLAVGNSLHAAYRVQQGVLLEHSLVINRAYAERLAHVTGSFLETSAQALQAAALDVTEGLLDPAVTRHELEQLSAITEAFTATFAVDASGEVFASWPQGAFHLGTRLQAAEARMLLQAHQATAVSGVFKDPAGNRLILIASPIFSAAGSYAGFVGGTIKLQGTSALQNALDKLHYQEGSYFMIVDASGNLVYHPDQSLLGSSSRDSKAVAAALRGEAGTERVRDSEGRDLLISHEPIPFAHWGVVAQRPTEVALSHIDRLVLRTFVYLLPLFVISLLLIWWLARVISLPLRELAKVAARLDDRASFSRIRFIKGWYLEAALIRNALMHSFSVVGNRMRKLHLQGLTDPLTGVINRRGLDVAVDRLMEVDRTVAVVMVDVDHFKAVNDEYGHAAGDEVLKTITVLIAAEARRDDVVARMGGEEFVILLPETERESAQRFAERLRIAIERHHFGAAGKLTISLGIACYPEHAASLRDALALADAALYKAKTEGRNCVRLA